MDDLDKEEKIYIVGVRCKSNGKVYNFRSDISLNVGDHCIVKTESGEDFGTVAIARRKIEKNSLKKTLWHVIHKVTTEDLNRVERNRELEEEAFKVCMDKAAEKGLSINLIRVDFSFDGRKATFYFTAEGRIDFRELVKDLAQHFKKKIELKQIGVRDEARMIGGCGPCGRRLCCTLFLKEFEPVSIRMAKDQDLSLNPVKISGICGRLMCCLMYEHEIYKELKKGMPKCGKKVITPEGIGRIIQNNTLQETVKIELEDGKRIDMKVSELKKG
ncbi:MAG: stage 0 sporulation family protein [Nitrospinae bacterium]|nr:stage 0 sporulation family protein [Nitrospinota bacterium]